MVNYKTKNRLKNNNRRLLWVIAVAVVLLAGGSVWWLSHREPAKIKQVKIGNGKVAKANPDVPGSDNSIPPSINISSSKDNDVNQQSSTLSPGVQPAVPIGDFVGTHFMSFSGKDGPDRQTSTCTTTPGATCQIRFTSGSAVKSLPVHSTNAQGNTSWDNWSLQSVGLTVGSWQVSAVAANGNKTAVATESMQLVVKP